jgi:hypothetical protein
MINVTAEQAMRVVKSHAERIKSDEQQRFPEAASAGDVFRQGDLYIWKIDEFPGDWREDTRADLQLAIGTSQGARHVLDSRDGVRIFQHPQQTELDGPILQLAEERVLTHPEHGDVVLPPGCYEITYQRQFADELRRVLD